MVQEKSRKISKQVTISKPQFNSTGTLAKTEAVFVKTVLFVLDGTHLVNRTIFLFLLWRKNGEHLLNLLHELYLASNRNYIQLPTGIIFSFQQKLYLTSNRNYIYLPAGFIFSFQQEFYLASTRNYVQLLTGIMFRFQRKIYIVQLPKFNYILVCIYCFQLDYI